MSRLASLWRGLLHPVRRAAPAPVEMRCHACRPVGPHDRVRAPPSSPPGSWRCRACHAEHHGPIVWPPADWRDVAGWDRYWSARTSERSRDGYDPDITPIEDIAAGQHYGAMRTRGVHRVLLVGNGIGQWPRALAHAGFDATALDVSAVATDYARGYTLSARELSLFFQFDEQGRVGPFAEHHRRDGGACAFVQGDLFDPTAVPGPFELIASSRSLQGFVRNGEVDLAVERLDQRLAPGGECRVVVQNSQAAWGAIERAFAARGYAVNPTDDDGGERKVLRGGIASG